MIAEAVMHTPVAEVAVARVLDADCVIAVGGGSATPSTGGARERRYLNAEQTDTDQRALEFVAALLAAERRAGLREPA